MSVLIYKSFHYFLSLKVMINRMRYCHLFLSFITDFLQKNVTAHEQDEGRQQPC